MKVKYVIIPFTVHWLQKRAMRGYMMVVVLLIIHSEQRFLIWLYYRLKHWYSEVLPIRPPSKPTGRNIELVLIA